MQNITLMYHNLRKCWQYFNRFDSISIVENFSAVFQEELGHFQLQWCLRMGVIKECWWKSLRTCVNSKRGTPPSWKRFKWKRTIFCSCWWGKATFIGKVGIHVTCCLYKQQLRTCITLFFYIFLTCLHDYVLKCLISRIMENVNDNSKERWNFLFLSELAYGP